MNLIECGKLSNIPGTGQGGKKEKRKRRHVDRDAQVSRDYQINCSSTLMTMFSFRIWAGLGLPPFNQYVRTVVRLQGAGSTIIYGYLAGWLIK